MNSFEAMQVQVKSIKGTWSSTCGGGGGVIFWGATECLADGEELNTIIALAVVKSIKMNKKSKSKGTYELEDDN